MWRQSRIVHTVQTTPERKVKISRLTDHSKEKLTDYAKGVVCQFSVYIEAQQSRLINIYTIF